MLGAGSLGSTIGGSLRAGGSHVYLVDTWREHVEAVNTRGLILREGAAEHAVRLQARTTADGIGPVDLVIVLVKSFHTREAIDQARSLVGPETAVMSLQNGLGHEDILADAVGSDHVLAGKTYVGGVLVSPGVVVAGVKDKLTIIGELDGRRSDRVLRIASEFNRAGLLTEVSDNIAGTMWDKLLINVATGALSGITRLPYGDLYAVPEVHECALAAVAEGIAVARARGVVLSINDAEQAWRKAAEGLPSEFKASILQSIEKGAPTEVDFINGSVVRWGERLGVPTPVNRTLVAGIKGIEHSFRQRSTDADAR